MKRFLCAVSCATLGLFLLGALNPVWAQAQVLVPGDPPLTQADADLFRKGMEWALDIQLTERQRGMWQALFVQEWAKTTPFKRRQRLANLKSGFAWVGKLDQMTDAQRAQLRQTKQKQFLASLRSSSDPDDRFFLAIYDDANKPGGVKNPILLAGDPPLLKRHLDQRLSFVEWILDLSLTNERRQEYQGLFIKEWKNADRSKKAAIIKVIEESEAALAKMNLHARNLNRAAFQPHFLAGCRKEGADADDRWLVSLYDTAYKPGGERNPILVAGKPPLTQSVVDRHGDYLEFVLGLSLSGLSQPKRQILRDYVVKDWKAMDRAARQEFLDTLIKWGEIAQQPPAERGQLRSAVQPKMLAQLRSARDNERSQWLLGLYDNEQRAYQIMSDTLRQQHEVTMRILGNLAPSGRYEYNPLTGRYDRYVPNR